MDTILSYRGNRPTNRQDRLLYTASQLSAQCKMKLGPSGYCTPKHQFWFRFLKDAEKIVDIFGALCSNSAVDHFYTRILLWKMNCISVRAAVAQWLRFRTCAQRTWVQFPLVPIWVIDGSRKGIRPKLLSCTLVPRYLCRHVRALEQRNQRR